MINEEIIRDIMALKQHVLRKQMYEFGASLRDLERQIGNMEAHETIDIKELTNGFNKYPEFGEKIFQDFLYKWDYEVKIKRRKDIVTDLLDEDEED